MCWRPGLSEGQGNHNLGEPMGEVGQFFLTRFSPFLNISYFPISSPSRNPWGGRPTDVRQRVLVNRGGTPTLPGPRVWGPGPTLIRNHTFLSGFPPGTRSFIKGHFHFIISFTLVLFQQFKVSQKKSGVLPAIDCDILKSFTKMKIEMGRQRHKTVFWTKFNIKEKNESTQGYFNERMSIKKIFSTSPHKAQKLWGGGWSKVVQGRHVWWIRPFWSGDFF